MQQHVRDYTELCLKDAYGIYTVQQDKIDMNINDLIEYVVEPVLKAAGYQQESVNAALYGSNDACTYKPELEKILDALHCDNTQQAIQKIDRMKLDIALSESIDANTRQSLGIELGVDPVATIKMIKEKADMWDECHDFEKCGTLTAAAKTVGLPINSLLSDVIEAIEELKHKADRWDTFVDVIKTHPITEVLIDGDYYTLHSVNHKNHVLGEVIKALGLHEYAKLNDVLGRIARLRCSAF